MYAVEIENLTIQYDNIIALKDINLKVEEKNFLAIIGPNGGGKSTLLKAMLGLIKPVAGSIKILGRSLEHSHGLMGYVPQFTSFDKNFPINVTDILLMGRLTRSSGMFHRYSKKDKRIAMEIMQKLEIDDLKDRQIAQLSGGQLQRVLIARALVVKPQILLLDEPTASIDITSKTHIYSLLKELNKEVTIILITHDIGVVSSCVNELACLNQELHYHGLPEMNEDVINKLYGCPVDLIAHGVPHRVLRDH